MLDYRVCPKIPIASLRNALAVYLQQRRSLPANALECVPGLQGMLHNVALRRNALLSNLRKLRQ